MIETKKFKYLAYQLRTQAQVQKCLLSKSSSVTFQQLLNLSVPHFMICKMGIIESTS